MKSCLSLLKNNTIKNVEVLFCPMLPDIRRNVSLFEVVQASSTSFYNEKVNEYVV